MLPNFFLYHLPWVVSHLQGFKDVVSPLLSHHQYTLKIQLRMYCQLYDRHPICHIVHTIFVCILNGDRDYIYSCDILPTCAYHATRKWGMNSLSHTHSVSLSSALFTTTIISDFTIKVQLFDELKFQFNRDKACPVRKNTSNNYRKNHQYPIPLTIFKSQYPGSEYTIQKSALLKSFIK